MIVTSLMLVALAADAGEGVPGCPAGYVCTESPSESLVFGRTRGAEPEGRSQTNQGPSRESACREIALASCRADLPTGPASRCSCPQECGASASAPETTARELPCCAPGAAGEGEAVPAVAHREALAPAPAPASARSSGEAGETGSRPPAKSRDGFREWAVGATAGLNFGSTLWLDRDPGARSDHHADSAAAFLIFADAMTSRGVSVGGILYSTSLDGNFGDADLLGLGGTLKARFRTRSNLELRPGILLAYQKMDVDTLDGSVKGLGAGVLLDVATSLGDSFGIVTTLGLLGQPAGGNGRTDVTFGPAFFWTGGIEFGN